MHISYYKKPCRHVRTCFREGRFLPLKYYSISHTTHAVFIAVRHCTTKCYSSTTLYYKVLVRYYSVLQSTSPALAAAPAPAAAAAPPLAPATPASAQHQRQHQRQHQHQHQRQRQHQQHQDKHQHQQHQRHHQQRAAPAPAESQFYYSFGRLTRTILRKGSSSTGRIAILPQFRALDTHDLTKGSHSAWQDRNFTTVSGDQHARSYERVHRAGKKSQFYYSFGWSTRTILRKGSSGTRKIAILLQFRVINTLDLTKGFIGQVRNRNFTTVSGDQHARSYERVHRAPARSQFYYSFGRSTRTILRKGSSGR